MMISVDTKRSTNLDSNLEPSVVKSVILCIASDNAALR